MRFLAFLVLGVVGCGGQLSDGDGGTTGGNDSGSGCTISATSYSQSCNTSSDCQPIFEGNVCTACACPNAAISKTAFAKYQSDIAGKELQQTCDCAILVAPICCAGTCGSGPNCH